MKIEKDTAVMLRYKITDAATGKVIDEVREPTAYLHGGYGNILPPIEAALDGQESGYTTTVTLGPKEGFGERDESLVQTIPKREFPPGVKVGGTLEGGTPDGRRQAFTVTKIKGDTVHLDGNHPWAGLTLRFALTVAGVRAATAEEIAHGHVHGAGGHHH